jgi:hypothetical protein
MPFTLSRIDMLDALQEMDSKKLSHYDAHCPRCRRATPIPRQRMEMFMPRWRDELKEFEKEMKAHPQQAAPVPSHAPEVPPVEVAEARPEPVPAKAKAKADTEAKPATKTQIGQKPAARAERGTKAPAKNTPAKSSSRGKKKGT